MWGVDKIDPRYEHAPHLRPQCQFWHCGRNAQAMMVLKRPSGPPKDPGLKEWKAESTWPSSHCNGGDVPAGSGRRSCGAMGYFGSKAFGSKEMQGVTYESSEANNLTAPRTSPSESYIKANIAASLPRSKGWRGGFLRLMNGVRTRLLQNQYSDQKIQFALWPVSQACVFTQSLVAL